MMEVIEPLSAYVRRSRGRNPEGSDWLADEIRALEDALALARRGVEEAFPGCTLMPNGLLVT